MQEEFETVRRCQGGDQEAFRELVERYGNVLRRTAYLLVRDTSVAEDVTQEAWIIAWRKIGTFRADTCFRAWVMRILVNLAATHRRRPSARTVSIERSEVRVDPVDRNPGPLDLVEKQVDRVELTRALGLLPAGWRQALVLRYFADLSVAEIASITGWPEGTVKSRIHRGLRALREVWRSSHPDMAWGNESAGPGRVNP